MIFFLTILTLLDFSMTFLISRLCGNSEMVSFVTYVFLHDERAVHDAGLLGVADHWQPGFGRLPLEETQRHVDGDGRGGWDVHRLPVSGHVTLDPCNTQYV